jgi:hypothetical protein
MGLKIPPAPEAVQSGLDGLDDDIFKGSRRVASVILAITQTLVRCQAAKCYVVGLQTAYH